MQRSRNVLRSLGRLLTRFGEFDRHLDDSPVTDSDLEAAKIASAKIDVLTAAYARQDALVSHIGTTSDTKASLLLVLTGVITASSFFEGSIEWTGDIQPAGVAGMIATALALATAVLSITAIWPRTAKIIYVEELVDFAETSASSFDEFKHYQLSLIRESLVVPISVV